MSTFLFDRYSNIDGLPSGLQGALDTLYDTQNRVASVTLELIARSIGLDSVDAKAFEDALVTPDSAFHRDDPLSDS